MTVGTPPTFAKVEATDVGAVGSLATTLGLKLLRARGQTPRVEREHPIAVRHTVSEATHRCSRGCVACIRHNDGPRSVPDRLLNPVTGDVGARRWRCVPRDLELCASCAIDPGHCSESLGLLWGLGGTLDGGGMIGVDPNTWFAY